MSKIGYIRVSTEHQETARQEALMKQYQVERIFAEKMSGKNANRPELKAMLEYVRDGDTLYIESISRLGRSTKDLLNIIDILKSKGVSAATIRRLVADGEIRHIRTGDGNRGKVLINKKDFLDNYYEEDKLMAHVSKRGNSFRIRVCTGTLNGKPIIKNTTYKPPAGTPPKKAEQLAQAYAVEYENHCKGFSQLNENMKFSELADWYFENYAPNELKGSTAYTYLGQYNNHIKPLLGHVRIKDINPPKLSQLMQTIELNPTSVKKLYVVMQSIFHRGVEQGFIRESPCHDVILPKRKKSKKNKAVEEDKLKRFLGFIECIFRTANRTCTDFEPHCHGEITAHFTDENRT